MKKILIITDAWYPQVNGVVTILLNVTEILKRKGYNVEIIHPGLFRTIPVFFYPEICLSITGRSSIEKLIQKIAPDYIHILTEGSLGLLARNVCKKRKIPFTTSYSTHFPLYLKMRMHILFVITWSYLRWFHNAAQRTMVSTESLSNELKNNGIKNIKLWPLGVDHELFKEKNRALTGAYKNPVFVYLGRLAKEKNVDEYFQLRLQGTKLVIGDGPERKRLEDTYGNKDTIFLGYKKGTDLVSTLSLADVFIFPSKTDTFGLVLIEALACGIPVAAHNVMGPKDIISTGIDGVLSENLEEAAIACLAIDPHKCREKALTFSWENSTESFLFNLAEINPTAYKKETAFLNSD
jgi:glycosyltransferase involved in cell wall biosynthesis